MEKKYTYTEIVREISALIELGIYPIGEKIFSEAQLVEIYGVTRNEAKKILDDLCAGGYTKPQQGKGTFVHQKKINQVLGDVVGISTWIHNNRREVGIKILEQTVMDAPLSVSTVLNLPPDGKVVYLKRLLFADKKPAAINEVYFDYERFPRLAQIDLTGVSLYEYLQRHEKVEVCKTRESVESTSLDANESALLGQRKNASAFLLRAVNYDQNDRPFEAMRLFCRGDMFQFTYQTEYEKF